MSVDIQSKKIVTKSLPKILNEIEDYARAANEAATNAKLAAEEAKRAKEAEAKARKETKEAMKRSRKAAEEARRAQKVEVKVRKEASHIGRKMAKREAENYKQLARKEFEAIMEKARKGTEEAKAAKEAEAIVNREIECAARDRVNQETEEAKHITYNKSYEAIEKVVGQVEEEAEQASTELYSGVIRLALGRQVEYENVRRFQSFLSQVQNLRVISVGGSTGEGVRLDISAESPIPLLSVLRETPLVRQVIKKGKEIQITLEAEQ
jgi:hypothetical protein